MKSTILKPVFFPSVAVIALLVLYAVIVPESAGEQFEATKDWVAGTFGWLYLISVGVFLFFIVGLAFSAYGKIKLGPDHSTPDYSNTAWFAMLFSAGMGIGLLFWGVAEPVFHYTAPPTGDAETVQAARDAMRITFFHWGLHAWAIYAVVGLVLGYFAFRHGLPLSIRSALYPLIGERIHGPIGHMVDTFAVLGTVFGVATSLGLGVLQINAGLNYLFDVPVGATTQIILIAIVAALATISVVLGLDGGIKRLSQVNLVLAVGLTLFILIIGPTLLLLNLFTQNLSNYVGHFIPMTFQIYGYEPNPWMGWWTLFYWAWWIAWAPFVGMFIARVSRGRTIREFATGVLLVPVGFTFLWMTVFGNTAIDQIMNQGNAALADAVSEDAAVALFQFLQAFPFSGIVSLLAVILVVTFFVTSSDSGSLVVDTIASGGRDDNPVWQRIFWAVLEGVVASALLLAGGLGALQAASIVGALPFVIIMLVACWGLFRALRIEGMRSLSLQHHMNAGRHGKQPGGWKGRVERLVRFPKPTDVRAFVDGAVLEAMDKVAAMLGEHGWVADVQHRDESGRARFVVSLPGSPDFRYEVRLRECESPTFAFPRATHPDQKARPYARAEVFLHDGGKVYDIYGYDVDTVASDIVDQFEKHRHFLHLTENMPSALPTER
ncbi:MAG: BCCT family transporter [Thioalkalivibrionaceae bacterium]